jgi:hypothetical protein
MGVGGEGPEGLKEVRFKVQISEGTKIHPKKQLYIYIFMTLWIRPKKRGCRPTL